MKHATLYWGLLSLLGIVHLHALFLNSPWEIPIYVTSLFVFGITYFFNKLRIQRVASLGAKWNSLLSLLQLLLVLIYFIVDPSWLYIIPFLVSIGIEYIRISFSTVLFSLEEEVKKIEDQRAHFNETFRIVRSERHDFLKHVAAVHFMLENQKHGEAKEYLDELVEGYKETNLSIKGERGVIAGTLHQMFRQAKNLGIDVVYDFDLPLSSLPLRDNKIVTLLGNLLSNSIDACEEWQHKTSQQASLTVQFYKRSGLYILQCKNNSLPIPATILDELYHSYGNTTKGNGHEGLGTKIIQDIINEAAGFLDFVYKDEEFTVKIKIPAIKAG